MDFFEKIDDYIQGKLSAAERQQFEAAMQSDPALQFAVEEYETGLKLSEALLESDMAQTLAQLRIDEGQKTSVATVRPMPNKPWRRYVLAASVAGLLALGTYLVVRPNPVYTQEQIMAEHYRAPVYDMERSRDINNLTDLESAQYLFHMKSYEASEKKLLNILSRGATSDRSEAQYYLGHIYLLAGDYDKATTYFTDSGFGDWSYQVTVVNCLQDPGSCEL